MQFQTHLCCDSRDHLRGCGNFMNDVKEFEAVCKCAGPCTTVFPHGGTLCLTSTGVAAQPVVLQTEPQECSRPTFCREQMCRIVCDLLVALRQLLESAVSAGSIQVSMQLHLRQSLAELPGCHVSRHFAAVHRLDNLQLARSLRTEGWRTEALTRNDNTQERSSGLTLLLISKEGSPAAGGPLQEKGANPRNADRFLSLIRPVSCP